MRTIFNYPQDEDSSVKQVIEEYNRLPEKDRDNFDKKVSYSDEAHNRAYGIGYRAALDRMRALTRP